MSYPYDDEPKKAQFAEQEKINTLTVRLLEVSEEIGRVMNIMNIPDGPTEIIGNCSTGPVNTPDKIDELINISQDLYIRIRKVSRSVKKL